MTDTTGEFKKQLPRNSFFQVLSFVTHVGIGIWLVPYLVNHLGRAAYGLIPIAGLMTQYVSLISHNVAASVNRFLTVALHQNDEAEANRVFNTAFFSYLAIALIQIPAFWLVIHHATSIFTIPETLHRDAMILLICSATAFLVNLLASVFAVPMYAKNRLDLSRSIDIARQVARVVGVVSLFLVLSPRLRYVGYVDLAVSISSSAAILAIGRRLAPGLRLDVRAYDWQKVRQLSAMGGWLLVNHLGAVLFLRMDIWVCNRFVGAEQAGDYAAILQWSNLIRHAGMIMAGVIAPMIVIYYARSEMDRLIRLSQVSVRVLSLVLAIPISLMCVFSRPLLRLWLGPSFASLWPLLVIMVCHLAINVGVMPLFNIQIAVNKVKWPGIITLIMGIVNLALAIVLAWYANWGIYGVALAAALVLTAKNALFTPIYGALVLGQPWYVFLRSYLVGLGFLGGLVALEFAVSRYAPLSSWAQLVGTGAIITILGLIAAWVVLSKRDRRLMVALVPGRLRTIAARLIPV